MADVAERAVSLPTEASFTNEHGLMWNETRVGNFVPVVLNKVDVESCGIVEADFRFQIVFDDGSKSDSLTKPLSEIDGIDWFELDIRCQLNPDCTKAAKYLAAIIRFALNAVATVVANRIDRYGFHLVDEEPVFCVGDRIVRSSDATGDLGVVFKPLKKRLAVDSERYTEKQAVIGVMKVIQLCPNAGRVIFSRSVLSVLREAFESVGVTPTCIVYLFGKSGAFKSSYAAFLSQMYDRDMGIHPSKRFDSSISAVEMTLYEVDDCPIVIDDLCPTHSTKQRREQEYTFMEIVRIIGDNCFCRLIMTTNSRA